MKKILVLTIKSLLVIILVGCVQTKQQTLADEPEKISAVTTDYTAEDTVAPLQEETQKIEKSSEAEKTSQGEVLLDNDYISVVYQEQVLYTKLLSHPDGFPAYKVAIKNKADKAIAVKPGKVVIDGDDGKGYTSSGIENASGDFSAQGLILSAGQEVSVHIGITRMNGKDYRLDDMKNVDIIIRVGDTDMEKMTGNILSED